MLTRAAPRSTRAQVEYVLANRRPGDFVFIPAGAPHVVRNTSATDPLVGILARTDPNEQESVVLLDAQGRKS